MGKNKACCAPPLPFAGNKKFWAGELYEEAALLPPGATVWDVFGGAGVCARAVKDARPDLRVVWNDFDGYAARVYHISETEELRRELLRVFGAEGSATPCRPGFKDPLSEAACERARLACLSHRDRYGYFDEKTVARWFSIGVTAKPLNIDTKLSGLYARVPTSPLPCARSIGWAKGLELQRCDFSELPISCGDFVILDPPYVATDCSEYSQKETLRILRKVREILNNCRFILFGDASISFWYEVLTEKFNPRFYVKEHLRSSFCTERSEVMYSNW